MALVIGNAAYQNTTQLSNPTNDATDVVAVLKRLGFEVIEGNNLDKRSMERLIRQFGIQLSGADLALFFYAGHGLQVGGQNYLVPTDARLASEGDVDFEGIALALVMKQMEREAKTSLILLDACRDNPLARNLARTMGTRSGQISQGLAEVRTGVGTLIGFATQPGNFALDGGGRNSPYTQALLKHVETPGKDVSAILQDVRKDVLEATNGKQVPWEHTSLTGQVHLKAKQLEAPKPVELTYEQRVELEFWASVKDSNDPIQLQAYLERYPNGAFAALARARIESHEKQQRAQEAAQMEERRRQEEMKAAAEITRLEEGRRARDAALTQERKRAEETKNSGEIKRLEEQYRAEQHARTEELKKAQEEARVAREAAKAAQSERLAAVKAAEEAAEKARKASTCGPGEALVNGQCAKAATRTGRPTPPGDLSGYSLQYWARNTFSYTGKTRSAQTPYGLLTCTSRGRDTPRACSLR